MRVSLTASSLELGKHANCFPGEHKCMKKCVCNCCLDLPKLCMLESQTAPLIRSMREGRKECPSPKVCRWLRPPCGRTDFSTFPGRGARPIRRERMTLAGMRLPGRRQALRHVNLENLRQNAPFSVSDVAQMRCDFRQFGHAPKKELELDARGFNNNALQGGGYPCRRAAIRQRVFQGTLGNL